jgi:hypothetical protein
VELPARAGFAKHDLLRCLGNRLEARAAETVDGDRWGLDRRAGPEPDVAGEVDGVSRGLENVAEDDVIHGLGFHAAPAQRALRGNHAQVGSGEVFQGSAETAKAGARAGQKDDFAGRGGSAHAAVLRGELWGENIVGKYHPGAGPVSRKGAPARRRARRCRS